MGGVVLKHDNPPFQSCLIEQAGLLFDGRIGPELQFLVFGDAERFESLLVEIGRVLLARRAVTYRGCYCFPCGYVEYDEEIREALVREIEEETGLIVEPGRIVAAYSNFHEPDKQNVGIWFRARPLGGVLRAGDDVDALLFAPVPDPGVVLAFPTDARVLVDLSRLPGRGTRDS